MKFLVAMFFLVPTTIFATPRLAPKHQSEVELNAVIKEAFSKQVQLNEYLTSVYKNDTTWGHYIVEISNGNGACRALGFNIVRTPASPLGFEGPLRVSAELNLLRVAIPCRR